MTGFRNFVVGCALAAASLMTPGAPAQAMPLPAHDLQIKTQGDVQNVQYYPYRRYGGVMYPNGWGGGWRGGWGPGYYGGGWGPSYRRGWGGPYSGSGFSLYFGQSYGGYYNNYPRYYNNYPRYYDDYYPRRYYRERYYYRDNYVRRGTSAHVSWCLSRYRSYNPATNRFLTYRGVYRACYSPYR
ncbi:BA14K family protein [Ensifer sp. 4252]|uniref:BA14K family protein n=1 Tax=Ensifer sp. 4252 TaxID=3373915 RepID=UPI003D230B88